MFIFGIVHSNRSLCWEIDAFGNGAYGSDKRRRSYKHWIWTSNTFLDKTISNTYIQSYSINISYGTFQHWSPDFKKPLWSEISRKECEERSERQGKSQHSTDASRRHFTMLHRIGVSISRWRYRWIGWPSIMGISWESHSHDNLMAIQLAIHYLHNGHVN